MPRSEAVDRKEAQRSVTDGDGAGYLSEECLAIYRLAIQDHRVTTAIQNRCYLTDPESNRAIEYDILELIQAILEHLRGLSMKVVTYDPIVRLAKGIEMDRWRQRLNQLRQALPAFQDGVKE